MPPRGLPPMVSCLVDDELEASGPPRAHFRRDHAAEFPALARVHPTTFARQAVNPRWAKRRVLARLGEGGPGWSTAHRCRPAASPAPADASPARSPGGSTRWPPRRSTDPGRPAEAEVIWDLVPTSPGVGPGDRVDRSPALHATFEAAGGLLLAPFKRTRRDPSRGRVTPAAPADRAHPRPARGAARLPAHPVARPLIPGELLHERLAS